MTWLLQLWRAHRDRAAVHRFITEQYAADVAGYIAATS
jgi:hypothetical protein